LGVVVSVLGACSGSGSDPAGNSTNTPVAPPGTLTAAAPASQPYSPSAPPTGEGLWFPTVVSGGFEADESGAYCLVTALQNLSCIVYDPDRQDRFAGALHGSVTVASGGEVSGSGKLYAAPDHFLSDGVSTVADFTISAATLSPDRKLLQVELTSLGQAIELSAAFDHYYYWKSSLAVLAGVYRNFHIDGDPASLSIDATGTLFMQSATGCVGNGQVSIITPDANAYSVDLEVAGCPSYAGTYSGSIALTDAEWVNGFDQLLFVVANESRAIVGEPIK
jgi:hypothetical protein